MAAEHTGQDRRRLREALQGLSQRGSLRISERIGAPVLPGDGVRSLAEACALSLRQVESEALGLGIVPERYAQNMKAFTIREQQSLLESGVCLVGLGGLGGWVLEILARMGVGSVRAVDGDAFEASNLNRQLLCTEETLGLPKTEGAENRLQRINPAVELELCADFLDGQGFAAFLRGGRLAADALGGLEVRRQLHQAAREQEIPVVSGALAGEVGYVSTIYPGDRGPFELWSGEEGAETALGCPPFAVAAVASVQCTEIVHILCGREPKLRGRLAVLDCLGLQWETFEL